jgi:glycosyltransferase involved in cell wall biosynthesis
MSRPVVSVVMSVFNGDRFLREALDSMLAQSFTNFEFLVINDGSTDASGITLEEYRGFDSRIQVFHQENKGLVESLNLGCALAEGKYIARMDADDISVVDRLQRQVAFLEHHPEVAAVGGAVEVIDATGKHVLLAYQPVHDRDIRVALLQRNVFWHPTMMIRRDVVISLGCYREIPDAEDYDLWLRMSESFQLANLGHVLLKYRSHPEQISTSKCTQQALSALAVRVAAAKRQKGQLDPLASLEGITTDTLVEIGIDIREQHAMLAEEYLRRARNMRNAREYSVALTLAQQVIESPSWRYADEFVASDLHLLIASLHWRRGQIGLTLMHTSWAIRKRPVVIGRPLKNLLRLFGRMDHVSQGNIG